MSFNYTTTTRVYDASYRKYYAGTMKLNSITEQDAQSNSLPAISFTYSDQECQL